jgi:hypothetical protein
MHKALTCVLAAVSIIAFGHPIAALAAPVTKADLAGKKICWSDGGTPTYAKNGAYDEPTFGHGAWKLKGGKLSVVTNNGNYTGTITKENDTFHISGHMMVGGSTKDIDSSGKYCD